jgi:hypothetical protein
MLQGQCIHTPRGSHSRGSAAAISRRPSGTAGDVTAASSQNKAWSDILLVFEDLLTKLKGESAQLQSHATVKVTTRAACL